MEKQEEKLRRYGVCYQPQVIVVGSSLQDIHSSYIQFDKERYEMPSVLEAMDGCYKIIQALNLQYSIVCLQSWYLLQRYIYKCINKSDDVTSDLLRVENLLLNTDEY